MKKRILLADIPIEIHTLFDSLRDTEAFDTLRPPAFTVEISEQDIAAEWKKSHTEAEYEGIPCPVYSPAGLENTAIYRKIALRLPEFDAIVFHGSAVAVGDKAYLFTAKSGTGKTTHTNLWLRNIAGSYVVNGDKPILRIINGTVFVCGTPWMGKEQMGCEKNVPLAGLCFLNRGNENTIERSDFTRLYPRLLGQTYRPPERMAMVKTIRLLEQIGKSVPLYELFCTMDDEAANVAYGGMSHDEI